MVWILSCSFKVSTSTLEFYSWIQYLTLFLSNSHHWKTFLHLPFSFWTQLFDLALMPEPVLYIWLRCQFCTRYSLAAFGQSPRQISNSASYIFNSTFEFLFTLQWSLVETKEAFVGLGDGDRSTSSPGLFVHHALWKKGVSSQHTASTSSQNPACSVKT